MIDAPTETFFDLLAIWNDSDSVGNEDLLAAILPLMQQVAAVHESGQVAPMFTGQDLQVDHGHLFFMQSKAQDIRSARAVTDRQRPGKQGAVTIVSELQVTSDDTSGVDIQDSKVSETADATPRYLTEYRNWESEAGHHDPITDVFNLGMIIASLATGLDFRHKDQLQTFTKHRHDLARLNHRLSPVICRAIERMTELERANRAQDMPTLIRAFENHRMIGSAFDGELSVSAAFGTQSAQPKGELLKRLRARLYDMTRRNRLVYHKPTATELNLTETSVPLVMNFQSIKPEHLFTANTQAMEKLLKGQVVALRDYIRFEDMQFAPSVLAKLRSESARIAREYGSAPLRLVPVFLRWYDLKNDPHTPISSPLLLLRTDLKRRKGVKDVFTIELLDTVAEVNPALSFALEKLYGIKLPATVDMAQPGALEDLHASIETQILSSEPGVRLEFSDRPRVQVLHQKVRRRLDNFNKRRIGVAKGTRARDGVRYSYEHPGFNPLGLQVFREFVSPAQAPNRAVMGRPLPRMFNTSNMVETSVTEKEATTFSQSQDTDGRFNWSFDLCSVTLANFNYRKMSLVRDYDAMLEGTLPANPAFKLLFEKISYETSGVPTLPRAKHRYPVIAMDPSQEKSILSARNGESYVIQGPPGTGKSQTITNLIADFIGQGKRVLFVCEKRAALDVVYNRLGGIGLGALCSLVHDSQQNKKEFIQELENIYTDWTTTTPDATAVQLEAERDRHLSRISATLFDIRVHIEAMTNLAEGSDEQLYQVIERAIAHAAPSLAADATSKLPNLNDWIANRDAVERALSGVKRMFPGQSIADRPEIYLNPELWNDDAQLNKTPELARDMASRAARLKGIKAHVFGDDTISVSDVIAQITFAARVATMAQIGQLGLLDPNSRESRQFAGELRQLDDKKLAIDTAQKAATAWVDKLTADETKIALRLAREKEGKLFSFLSGPWRQLRKTVAARTDTKNAAVQPTTVDLLTVLNAEHEALASYGEAARQLASRYGMDDFEALTTLISERSSGRMEQGLAIDPILTGVTTDVSKTEQRVIALADFAQLTEGLMKDSVGVVDGLDRLPFHTFDSVLEGLAESGPVLQDLKFLLAPLANASAALWQSMRTLNLSMDHWDGAVLHETVRRSLIKTPGLDAIDTEMLEQSRAKIAQSKAELHTINARLLERRAIDRFDAHLALTTEMDRNLSTEDRERKSSYSQARRALEHEFKKTRAYRSPREMLDGPAGALIPDMKPIWLMSPLSVADVLPFETDLFDVVIFDEASQIPVEDAIPTLMRAPQVIVVGDEMQLPPSQFFGTSANSDDFDEADEAEEDLNFELSQDSFLTLSTERLKSTMLNWHYRSRSEELISFSNSAFYSGRLLTIPSTQVPKIHPQIQITEEGACALDVAEVLKRPISFHKLDTAVYALRRNTGEAQYIAKMLRDLLALENGKTIGIVAFSEAQQGEIENALTRLATSDPAFAKRLDAEFEREEDGEFVGLFVKNLENVQGDERDIILLSICYAPAANGKMRMNFGPINKMGGEKRLNVIFSRAKENMIVVSSITSDQITNDYNHGANALKTFLRYAQLSSIGDQDAARTSLKAVASGRNSSQTQPHLVAQEIATALTGAGFETQVNVGMSAFSVDVAVRRSGGDHFALAVLLDTGQSYKRRDTIETLTDRATLLRAFGWSVVSVTLKEWLADSSKVIQKLEQQLQ